MGEFMQQEIKCVGCLMSFDINEPGCEIRTLFGETGLTCRDCITAFEGIESYTNELQGDSMLGKTVTSYQAPVTSSIPVTPIKTYGCTHHLQPFTFDDKTIYLTGSNHTKDKAQSDWPDAGVYLASGWFKGAAASTDGFDLGITSWPSLFIDWPDMGVVTLDVLEPCIEWAKEKVNKGKKLEIACVGGHGRTGTYAVALMIGMGMDTFEAFSLLKDKYCDKAVESRAQGELLVRWAKYLKE
jgi:hypothetical protein